MPSKFPKVFQKRKSSSNNALEEIENPPASSSFRVLERPPESSKSFERPTPGRRTSEFRPMSEGNYLDDRGALDRSRLNSFPFNRGSGGTQKSNSSGVYDTSSSGRYSSTSTLPSSASIETPLDDLSHAHPRSSKTMPVSVGSKSPTFLQSAGRKLSFGGRKSHLAAEQARSDGPSEPEIQLPPQYGIDDRIHVDLPDIPPLARTRATTDTSLASENTVVPTSKLADLDFGGEQDDGFADIFAGIGQEKRRSQMMGFGPRTSSMPPARQLIEAPRPLTKTVTEPQMQSQSYRPYSRATPAPLHPTRSEEVARGPDTAQSQTSIDHLITSSPTEELDGLFFTQKRPSHPPTTIATDSLPSQNKPPSEPNSPSSPGMSRPKRRSRTGSKVILARRDTDYFEDTDALLVNGANSQGNTAANSPNPNLFKNRSEDLNRNPWIKSIQGQYDVRLDEEGDHPPAPPVHAAIQANPTIITGDGHDAYLSPSNDTDEALLQDDSIRAFARASEAIQSNHRRPQPAGKVMTPAQFERYRREASDDSDSDGGKDDERDSDEDVEDELERHRQMAKQRQRQEAQLSVYRQSMMKITGEKPLSDGLRRPGAAAATTSRLSSRLSSNSLREQAHGPAAGDEEDEDEDVPLGILAAHGFPGQGRPPNHVRSGSAAGIQYASETYPAPATPGELAAAGTSLPAFARSLPRDPFNLGAGLVSQADRQSFALGGGATARAESVYGGSQIGGGGAHLQAPRGGLVGVIANEERARALRRGSPRGPYAGFAVQDPNGSLPLPAGMGGLVGPQQAAFGTGVGLGAEQAQQLQMAQMAQMAQMMQAQMQFMQQMMAMQGQGQGMPLHPAMMQMQQMQGMNGMGMGMPGMQLQMPGANGINGMAGNGIMPGQQRPGMKGMKSASGRASTMIGLPRPSMSVNTASRTGNARTSSMGVMPPAQPPSFLLTGAAAAAYTPSIAPSERSNIGQPSRYRPVSTMPTAAAAAASHSNSDDRSGRTLSLGGTAKLGLAAGHLEAGGRQSRASMLPGHARPSTSGGGVSPGKNVVGARVRLVEAAEEEDEEGGWEEMRRTREAKKGFWRRGKARARDASPGTEQAGLEGVFVPAEGSV